MFNKHFLITIATLLIILISAGIAIFLAKGYTFSPKEGRILGTGIISITSTPDAASVYLDGHLTTATNTTISSLPPKTYTVKVLKEGFIPWEKKVEVKEGLVNDLKITLFPAIPTIYPLTFTGVKNVTLSPDSTKLAYIVPNSTDGAANKKAGVWVWTLVENRPIAFARGAQPHQIAASGRVDYSNASLRWSSDSKQLLATIGINNYLLNDEQLNTDPRDITPTIMTTLKSWDDDLKQTDNAKILTLKDLDSRNIASSSAILKWSPDETKFIFRKESLSKNEEGKKTVSGFKVYDLENKSEFSLPSAVANFWLPDSRHVVLVEENQISIVDFDGTNKAVIYAGKFEEAKVFAWPDASKLVFISSFPTPTASQPNLYGVNLK